MHNNALPVAVIDDKFDGEARILIETLWRMGFTVRYCSGQPGEMPEENAKWSDVKLVFLDLHLIEDPNTHAVIRSTASVLGKIIDLDFSSLGIVLWTKHHEDIETFRQALADQYSQFKPAFILGQEKTKYLLGDSEDLEELEQEIKAKLGDMPGYLLGLEWSGLILQSGTETLGSLLDLSEDDSSLLLIYRKLIRAIGGNPNDKETAVGYLYQSLNEVLGDKIARRASIEQAQGVHIDALCDAGGREGELDQSHRAKINTVLMTSRIFGENNDPQIGNLYVQSMWPDGVGAFPGIKEPGRMRSFMYAAYRSPMDDSTLAQAKKDELKEMAKTAVPCLLDVSPACDHAQGKLEQMRLLSGVLIKTPGDTAPSLAPNGILRLPSDSRLYANQTNPMHLHIEPAGLDGDYYLLLNARMLSAVDKGILNNVKPAVRIRHGVVADIQHWLSSHGSRPGQVSL